MLHRNDWFVGERAGLREKNRQTDLKLCLSHHGLFTTRHPYSNNSTLGDIRALRPSVVIRIPYKHIKPYRPRSVGIETLINIFIHKKKIQKDILHHLVLLYPPIQRCIAFATELPEIYWNLSCTEQAAAMNVSLNTAKRARKKLMDG